MMIYAREPKDQSYFLAARRDMLLAYKNYSTEIKGNIESFQIITASLANLEVIRMLPADRPMVATRRRAWDAVVYLHLQYSAGEQVVALSQFLPTAIDYLDEFAHFHKAFHATPEAPYIVAHATLGDDEYWDAIRLTSFAILLGHTNFLGRLCKIWDYGDQALDGLP